MRGHGRLVVVTTNVPDTRWVGSTMPHVDNRSNVTVYDPAAPFDVIYDGPVAGAGARLVASVYPGTVNGDAGATLVVRPDGTAYAVEDPAQMWWTVVRMRFIDDPTGSTFIVFPVDVDACDGCRDRLPYDMGVWVVCESCYDVVMDIGHEIVGVYTWEA